MNARKQKESDANMRAHILELYQQLVGSIREAQSLQSVVEKEQQLRRLRRYLRGNRQQTA